MAKIENHSIDEAFRECFYIVPDYQRHLLYAFRVEGDGGVLVQGRAAIALGATGGDA